MSADQSIAGRFELRQDAETPLTTLSTPFGTVLYLYARSGDSVSSATVGQDYVTFQYGKANLAFTVCDGVGQSFMGDLAARVLGDGLTEWLWGIDRPDDAGSFSKAVTEALDRLTEKSAQQVADFKLPEHLPPLVVQALEMQRKYGSESMFVAGRLSLAGDDPWIALCWLGDSPVAAIDIDGQLVDLGPKGHTSERWNSSTGVKGTVHTWVGGAERVARVAGYTDGLSVESVPTDADLARMMRDWVKEPPADDASLFDVRLAPSPQTVGEPEPETLEQLSFEADDTRPIPAPETEKGAGERAEAEARPIVVEGEQRTPVAGVEPIEAASPDETAVGEWRPLAGTPDQAGKPALVPDMGDMSGLSTQQQIRMWQQAALLGLTSAALAMLMVERLLSESGEEGRPG
jgi:hypothetical protein